MFPSGQPLLQNGMPQSMQRAACFFTSSTDGSCLHLVPVVQPLLDRPVRRVLASGTRGSPSTLPIAAPRVAGVASSASLQVLREHLHELRREAVPLAQHLFGALAARVLEVAPHHALQDRPRPRRSDGSRSTVSGLHARRERRRLGRARRRCRRSCRRRSSGPSRRGSRRARRSCTRSRDRRRPRRPPARRCCAPRSARPRCPGSTPRPRSRRRAPRCR